MKEDLIYYIVSRRKWKEWQKGGVFSPPELERGEPVCCLLSDQVNTELNRSFSGRRHLLLLVIDCSRIHSLIRYIKTESGEKRPCVEEGINLDAVIDRIELSADENGGFDLEIRMV